MRPLLLPIFLALASSAFARSYSSEDDNFGLIVQEGSLENSVDAVAIEQRRKPTVYFIRHGEKPKRGNGLSAEGIQRAQCLRNVFGGKSEYGVGYIMAQAPKANGKQKRPLDTVKPLARDLGIKVDTGCERDDTACVVKKITQYSGKGNILICWEHKRIHHIVKALGAKGKIEKYPEDRFDLIWTDPPHYHGLAEIESENCPDLDGKGGWDDIEDMLRVSEGKEEEDKEEI